MSFRILIAMIVWFAHKRLESIVDSELAWRPSSICGLNASSVMIQTFLELIDNLESRFWILAHRIDTIRQSNLDLIGNIGDRNQLVRRRMRRILCDRTR